MNDSPTEIQPDGWPRGGGYAHGTSARGRIVTIGGQIGWDPRTRQLVAPDFAPQVAQALANVAAVLHAGGGRAEHLTSMTWYLTDRRAYLEARHAIGSAYRERFGKHYPAMSVVVVSALLEEGALVEIAATAVIPD